LLMFLFSSMNRFKLYQLFLDAVRERGRLTVVEAHELSGVHPNFILQIFSDLGTIPGIIYSRKHKCLFTTEGFKKFLEKRAASRQVLDIFSELMKIRKEVRNR